MSTARPWFPAASWAGLIFLLSSLPGHYYPPSPFLSADKLVHALVYGVLGALTARALRHHPRWTGASVVLPAGIIAALYGVTDEVHQLFVRGRSADWADVVADAAGAFVGAYLLVAPRSARADRTKEAPS